MPQNQTQEEFLKDLNPDNKPDVLTTDFAPVIENTEPQESEEEREERLNRRDRRYIKKLEADRESAIEMADRLARITEAQRTRTEEPDEYLKQVERIYGTNSPEASEATELLKTALKTVETRATERALEQFREEQQREQDSVAQEEKSLDSMIDDIEDETGQTLDEQTKQGFYQLLEKLSPKDKDGNIIEYADHNAVWDELEARRVVQPNRAKDLAARSMVNSGSSPRTGVEAESNERWLRENGII